MKDRNGLVLVAIEKDDHSEERQANNDWQERLIGEQPEESEPMREGVGVGAILEDILRERNGTETEEKKDRGQVTREQRKGEMKPKRNGQRELIEAERRPQSETIEIDQPGQPDVDTTERERTFSNALSLFLHPHLRSIRWVTAEMSLKGRVNVDRDAQHFQPDDQRGEKEDLSEKQRIFTNLWPITHEECSPIIDEDLQSNDGEDQRDVQMEIAVLRQGTRVLIEIPTGMRSTEASHQRIDEDQRLQTRSIPSTDLAASLYLRDQNEVTEHHRWG